MDLVATLPFDLIVAKVFNKDIPNKVSRRHYSMKNTNKMKLLNLV